MKLRSPTPAPRTAISSLRAWIVPSVYVIANSSPIGTANRAAVGAYSAAMAAI